ncbi:unnamed protein product [Somion occarium]|uniref:Uncharacterized protein n=1 Tax=Somion occarium TaxID=3059160 RepID=A0ABP1DGG3_9APHY
MFNVHVTRVRDKCHRRFHHHGKLRSLLFSFCDLFQSSSLSETLSLKSHGFLEDPLTLLIDLRSQSIYHSIRNHHGL